MTQLLKKQHLLEEDVATHEDRAQELYQCADNIVKKSNSGSLELEAFNNQKIEIQNW